MRLVMGLAAAAVLVCAPGIALAQSHPSARNASWLGASFMTLDRESAPRPALARRAPSMTWAPPDAPRQSSAPPPVAIEYSDAYRLRARIHRYASFATLPLFVGEAIVGQSLYRNPTAGKKDAHLAIATGIGVLFGVNTVTGVWNLVEARKDPHGRARRLLHGILLLAADAGFLATAATAPDSEREHGGAVIQDGRRSLHRAVAFTSISLATAGYLVMLIGGR